MKILGSQNEQNKTTPPRGEALPTEYKRCERIYALKKR